MFVVTFGLASKHKFSCTEDGGFVWFYFKQTLSCTDGDGYVWYCLKQELSCTENVRGHVLEHAHVVVPPFLSARPRREAPRLVPTVRLK